MPKIKNWSKKGKNSWINTLSKERGMMGMGSTSKIFIKKVGNKWKTIFSRPTNPKSKTFNTKKKAKDKAVRWMKNNPGG